MIFYFVLFRLQMMGFLPLVQQFTCNNYDIIEFYDKNWVTCPLSALLDELVHIKKLTTINL